MDNKDIYNMELHDVITLDFDKNTWNIVVRVAGGWIYRFRNPQSSSAVFVPFDNQFQKPKD